MTSILSKVDMLNRIAEVARAHGLTVTPTTDDECRGEYVAIRSKWLLGGRKVAYRMTCGLVEDAHAVVFREAVHESAWGIPPPTPTVERSAVSGTIRSGTRSDVSPGGGGLDHAAMREAIERVTSAAGWRLRIERRLP